MLKAGIFLDIENLTLNGGYGMQYKVVKKLVRAQGAVVLRANAYMPIDAEREAADYQYRQKRSGFREAIRQNGYHLVLKQIKRYQDEGQLIVKANADLDLAVDALLQSQNLDYVLLGSGDGDFLRLVRALQDQGKRVDALAFVHVSNELRNEVDYFFSGPLIPGLLPAFGEENKRERGIMHQVNEEKGYGFLTVRTGLGIDDVRSDVFLHISDFSRNGYPTSNADFAALYYDKTILEFDLVIQRDGRAKAEHAKEYEFNLPS